MAVKKEAKKEDNIKPTCFVIMPFSDPEGYEKGHFRKIYDHTFIPAIEAAGYNALRIDDNSVSNLIHSKMMNELVTAPMVLCDLSTNNPNVLYELGIRHAFDLPVVLVQEIGQKRIFDIGGITSVEYHPSRLYEDVLEDQKKITDAICKTANAKNKYSIMSLVSLHAAKPMSGDSVTPEDKLEYLIQNLVLQMNNLEKQISESHQTERAPNTVEGFESPEELYLRSLSNLLAEVNYFLDYCGQTGEYTTFEDIDKYTEDIINKITLCRRAGVNRARLKNAYDLLERLSVIRKSKNENRPDAEQAEFAYI